MFHLFKWSAIQLQLRRLDRVSFFASFVSMATYKWSTFNQEAQAFVSVNEYGLLSDTVRHDCGPAGCVFNFPQCADWVGCAKLLVYIIK